VGLDTPRLAESLVPRCRETMARLGPQIRAEMPHGRGLISAFLWTAILRFVLPWLVRVVIEHLFLAIRDRDPQAGEFLRAAGMPYGSSADAVAFLPEVLQVADGPAGE
jgi:hypothetical protein